MTRWISAPLLALTFCAAARAQRVDVRGVYSDPRPIWNAGHKLGDLGINAIFVHGGSINQALLDRAAAEGASVYAEFATLNGKGYVETHPEAWPVNEKGERAPAATWFMGACPTDPAFRQYRARQLEELLDKFNLAGVWLDYFHWHAQFEDPSPLLPETCFNGSCLRAFQKSSGIRLPVEDPAKAAQLILAKHERAWRSWRAGVLLDWAREFRSIVRRRRPGALIGLYHCPWTDAEFGGARYRTLGLDIPLLAQAFDVFSPMVYHGRMGQTPAWVGASVTWLAGKVGAKKVWPIVQATGEPNPVAAPEFESVMRQAAAAGSPGLMMFTTRAIAEDPAKTEVLRRLYREWTPPSP